MLKYPNIDPVIVHIWGPMAIRWYSLAYVVGFLLSYWFIKRENRKLKFLTDKDCDSFLSYSIFGLIVGARVFDCLVYNFQYTIQNPLSIFRVWDGGLSFHGGAMGLWLGMLVFGLVSKCSWVRILDLAVITIPVALFFGRIANFINGELFGRISLTSPFAMVFPTDRLQMPRHPSQLYEAFLEGLVLFGIMLTLYKKTNIIKKRGLSSGIFGIFYSIMRFIVEFFRQPETPIDPLPITMGQLLSILFLLFCVCWILFWSKKNKNIDKKYDK